MYYVVYTGYSEGGPLVCLATTRDFVTFERQGVLMSPEDKDAALFPQTFDGRWALLHRPAPALAGLGAHVWLSWSPDLHYWGDGQRRAPGAPGRVVGREQGGRRAASPQDRRRDGCSATTVSAPRCREPSTAWASRCSTLPTPAACSRDPTSGSSVPPSPYERSGDVPGVVFPTGWVLDADGDTLRIYYGAADNVVAGASGEPRAHPGPPGGLTRRGRTARHAGRGVGGAGGGRVVRGGGGHGRRRRRRDASRWRCRVGRRRAPSINSSGSPGYADDLTGSALHVFWGDERCVPPFDPDSDYRMAKETLLDHVAIPEGRVHRIRGEDAAEPRPRWSTSTCCAARSASSRGRPARAGRFDLVLLGMGEDGHTASLFPGTDAVRETTAWARHVVADALPRNRVSLTPPILNAAARKLFLVTGVAKAPILARVLEGPHDPDALPSQAIEGAEWFVDAAGGVDADRLRLSPCGRARARWRPPAAGRRPRAVPTTPARRG